MAGEQIDRDKLRAAIRRMDDEYIYYMLDEAIDLLPQTKLLKLVKGYLDPARLRPDGTGQGQGKGQGKGKGRRKGKGDLLADVKAFEKASLNGDYYEDFDVNSKNFMDVSKGTRAWIAGCQRLLDRCVAQAKKGPTTEVRAAFETIFALLDHIDECLNDVVFFADEGGSWQVGVDWARVLPAWFPCLSASAKPDEFARRVTEVVDKHERYRRDEHLATARRIATPAQRKALDSQALQRAK